MSTTRRSSRISDTSTRPKRSAGRPGQPKSILAKLLLYGDEPRPKAGYKGRRSPDPDWEDDEEGSTKNVSNNFYELTGCPQVNEHIVFFMLFSVLRAMSIGQNSA